MAGIKGKREREREGEYEKEIDKKQRRGAMGRVTDASKSWQRRKRGKGTVSDTNRESEGFWVGD